MAARLGYGNVAVNRQQPSYSYLEGGKDWSVSGILHLLHSSSLAEPDSQSGSARLAQFSLTISP